MAGLNARHSAVMEVGLQASGTELPLLQTLTLGDLLYGIVYISFLSERGLGPEWCVLVVGDQPDTITGEVSVHRAGITHQVRVDRPNSSLS